MSLLSNVVEIAVKAKDETKAGFADAEKGASSFGSKVARGAKVATGALVALGGGAMYVTGKAEEARVAQNNLANSLENAGYGAATERAAAYADELEKQLAIDGETIKVSQAKLATFESLAATADQAGGAFDRATVAAQDMAAKGLGSAESQAIKLGSMLENPIANLGKLKRAGVEFTDAEQDRIKTLVESNRLGEAQDMILDKVESKFAGAAEATKTNGAAMGLAFENITEALGAGLLPHMDKLTAIVQASAGFVAEHSNVVMVAAGVLAGLAVTVIAVHAAITTYTAVTAVITAATKGWTIAQKALNFAMKMNPIGLVVTAIMLLVGALILAYKKSDTFRRIVDGAFRGVQKAAKFAFDWVKDNWPLLLAIITGPIGLAVLAISKNKDKIVGFFRAIPGGVEKAFKGLAGMISSPFTSAFASVKSLWNSTVGGFGFTVPDWVPGVGGNSFHIPEMARGGIRGGYAIVGERGRELVRLPQGSSVIPNGTTESMLAGGGGNGGRFVLELRSDGSRMMDLLVEILRQAIRERGGDVQVVLGR